jgi:hypothetical protein
MPFKSKAQMKYLWANHPEVAAEFAKETKDMKNLPERVKQAMATMDNPFSKIAKALFNPRKNPQVPHRVTQTETIEASKEQKTQGKSPVEFRNELTSRRTGIVQKNKESIRQV